jgi:hypothetical protein
VLALVACLGWLFGVEGLPALHQAHHDDHHTHDAMGAVVDHGDHAQAELADHGDDLDQLAIDHPVVPAHDSGGLSHHAVALQAVVPPALEPVTQQQVRVELSTVASAIPFRATKPSARGPPANA